MAGGTGKIVHQMRTASVIDFKTVTGHATDQTIKGTPVELVASLPQAAQFVKLMVAGSQASSLDSSMLLDILTDTGGGDVIKVPNIQVGFAAPTTTSNPGPRVWGLPLAIPSGAQVLAQVATLIDADTVLVAMDFYGGFGGPSPADSIDTMGADTATVKGVNLLTGATDVEGLWTEVEDSTPGAYKALAVSLAGKSTMTAGNFLLDIGAGSLGSEGALISNIPFTAVSSEIFSQTPDLGVFPLENQLSAGSRLVARLQSSLAANTDIYVQVHGIK